jgi:hypothetical protein
MKTYLIRYEDSESVDTVVVTYKTEDSALEKVVDLMLDKDFTILNILELKFNSRYPGNTPTVHPMEIDITGSHFELKYLPLEGK